MSNLYSVLKSNLEEQAIHWRQRATVKRAQARSMKPSDGATRRMASAMRFGYSKSLPMTSRPWDVTRDPHLGSATRKIGARQSLVSPATVIL